MQAIRHLFPIPSLAAILALSFLPTALADEVRLKDGRCLVGKTKELRGRVEVHTVDGIVRVPKAEVLRIRSDAELRAELDRLAMNNGGQGYGLLELAKTARRYGLHQEMWLYLSVAMERSLTRPSLRPGIQNFMRELEPQVLKKKWRRAAAEKKVPALLRHLKNKAYPSQLATVATLMAQVPEADKVIKKEARKGREAIQRVAAIRALAQRPSPEPASPDKVGDSNGRFIFRSAILDRHPQVRKEAMQLTLDSGKTQAAVLYLTPVLLHQNPDYRIRTAKTFAHLRDPAAVDALVAAGPSANIFHPPAGGGGDGSTRANMVVTSLQAYIRDFDPEIAQGSVIANPQVGVVQSGVVLDVKVLSVQSNPRIVPVFREALRELTGDDPGADAKLWAKWNAERRQQGSSSNH